MRHFLVFFIKFIVSISLLYLSVRWVDLGQVLERFQEIDLIWIGLVGLLLTGQVFALAYRWRHVIRAAGADIPLPAVIRFSFIGAFFNQTLPSTIGGDAARMWLLARDGAGWKIGSYSVLIDRGIGLVALCVLVLICLPWTLELISDPVARTTLLTIGLGGVLGGLAFIALPKARGLLPERWWPARHLLAIAETTLRLGRSPRTLLAVASSSLLIHFLSIAAIWAAAMSFGARFDFHLAVYLVPPVMLIASIPISVAGWGLRESEMIAGFGYLGLTQGDGLVVSIIMGLVALLIGAGGGILWILSKERMGAILIEAQERR